MKQVVLRGIVFWGKIFCNPLEEYRLFGGLKNRGYFSKCFDTVLMTGLYFDFEEGSGISMETSIDYQRYTHHYILFFPLLKSWVTQKFITIKLL
jgi:hypothetical protein